MNGSENLSEYVLACAPCLQKPDKALKPDSAYQTSHAQWLTSRQETQFTVSTLYLTLHPPLPPSAINEPCHTN